MAAAIAIAGPSVAQVTTATPATTPTPLPGITPGASAPSRLPIPPAPVIVLPTATPSAAPPAPRATPTPRATASPTPRAIASATLRAAASPTPRATPSPTPTADEAAPPVAPPTPPVATPSPTVTPTSQPTAVAAPEAGFDIQDWLIPLAAIGGVLLLVIGWVALRRRRDRREEEAFEVDDGFAGAVDPTPARARLAISFRPIRAGLNLLSAISENEIVVANIGSAPADNIRLLTQLTSAHTGQDAELAAIYAAPIGRPAVPAFALAPGEKRTITTVAALPRDALRTLTAAGRPMFVPVVAVNVTYATAGIEGQLAQSFAIGVERVDSAKLAPFWLDALPKTVEQVAARPHAAALER